MDKRAIRTPDGARDILKYNINVIYHLPKKYKNLNKALKDVEVGGHSNRIMGLDGRSFYKHHKSVK